MILDNGFALLLGNSGDFVFARCQVGSGSTPVSASQSALVSPVAATENTTSVEGLFQNLPPYEVTYRAVYRFAAGVAAGNLAEVGVGSYRASNFLFCRALILDGNGNPTTVTVLPDEILDVTYTFTARPDTSDQVSTLNINGVAHAVTVRPAALGSAMALGVQGRPFWYNPLNGTPTHLGDGGRVGQGELGPVTGVPSGQQTIVSGGHSLTAKPYQAGSLAAESTYTLPVTHGNLQGGFTTLFFQPNYGWPLQIKFDPPIPKTASQVFRIDLRMQLARL